VHTLNRALISGGSSGGECSLVAARGSILGIGTDIGGSIRIPAGLCGLYGLSPSSGRQPYERKGYISPLGPKPRDRQRLIVVCIGCVKTWSAPWPDL
jgi:Asp-tRNA(Asn)/Glu-tRNA(Gln) amidotransferase A subunit family amidase